MTTTSESFKAIPKDEQRMAQQLARTPIKKYKSPTNEQFAAMSPAEKRVAVARDVLLWLDIKKLTPEPGTYLLVGDGVGDDFRTIPTSKLAVVNGHSCRACALGAVFAVAAERGEFKVSDADADADAAHGSWSQAARKRLEDADVFSAVQLRLIECAFECASGFREYQEDPVPFDKAAQYGIRILRSIPGLSEDEAPRLAKAKDDVRSGPRLMRAIMGNIIDNGGTFIP